MAITIQGLDTVIDDLNKLADKAKVDEIAKEALNAVKPRLVQATQSAISAAGGQNVAGTVKPYGPETNSYGNFEVARPVGNFIDKNGRVKRAGLVAAMMEYQNGQHWRAAAAANAQSVKDDIERIVTERMGCE